MGKISWNEALEKFSKALGFPISEAQTKALAEYVRGYQLLLAGKPGTGKTSFFKTLHAMRFSGCAFYNIQTQAQQKRDWILEDMEYYREQELVIDDVGREAMKNEFGERFEVLDLIMAYREEWCANVRTHYVTNLTPAELEARYGERVMSRFHFCKVIGFADGDKRRPRRFV